MSQIEKYDKRFDVYNKTYDIAVIGGGIVGLSTAMALSANPKLSIIVLEAERIAAHQTGHNSGVVHSGLYYKPGSLKAQNCVKGRDAMYRFCEEHDVEFDKCGKVVVATTPEEIPALDTLEERGQQNGLNGLRRLRPEEIKEYEPHVQGVDGLFVPDTGIVNYVGATKAYAKVVKERGGEVLERAPMLGYEYNAEDKLNYIRLPDGVVRCRNLINCAGLQSDRIARMCGVKPELQIVPFRGEYYVLVPEKEYLVKNLIYPVPDPKFPFLGVHFTRMIRGGIEAGPNAVIAFKREGYKVWDISPRDILAYSTYLGFWRMASQHWKIGFVEFMRSISRYAFVNALKKLVPELEPGDVKKGGAGVRAQALGPDGQLLDDFYIIESERMVHVLNAPSPAATASISIGESIAGMAAKNFDLDVFKN